MVKSEEKGDCQTLKKSIRFSGALSGCIARIPQAWIIHVGKLLGLLAFALDRRHRRIVKRNLHFIHPHWSRNRIEGLSRAVFQNAGITFLEICQMNSLSCEDILHKVRIRGEEHLLNAVRHPQSAIMLSAHLGNWEMAHVFGSCYLETPLVLVARPLRSQKFNAWLHRLRTRFGNVILDRGGAMLKMARMLRQGKPVGLLIDQGTLRSEGIEIAFFGKTVTATPAAAILARRLDSLVIPAFCVREADGRLTIMVQPPLALQKTDDIRADIYANTQIMNQAVEDAVRAYPDQWFWFHKRWKRHYPHLYPEDLAKRQRQKEKKKARWKKQSEGNG
jgi:KDO2-lipid IV(A) lauroyltransferase